MPSESPTNACDCELGRVHALAFSLAGSPPAKSRDSRDGPDPNATAGAHHRTMHACSSVQFSSVQLLHLNNRQPNGSLSNVLSRLAVGVRVDGDDGTLN
jgi:hypothetical protein